MNRMAGALEPTGSLIVCQIFQGVNWVMSSLGGRRSTLTSTCGPDEMPMLLTSARAAALHTLCKSSMISGIPLPQNAPGHLMNEVLA